jgi:hypothetical protein
MGGLGNFLFQIAAGYSFSIDNKTTFFINEKFVQSAHNSIDYYKSNLFSKLEFSDITPQNTFQEVNFNYIQLPKLHTKTILHGYFQSEKYFKHNSDKILELFSCPEILRENLIKKYSSITNKKTCSIHVRRGNYLDLQSFHPTQTLDYYKSAISLFGDIEYYIFSDDINWCKDNFTFLKKVVFVENNTDYEDLYLMSFCENNIIANSTFSWWGSWLNVNKNKKVIAPSKWFGTSYSHLITNDLYCDNWIII